MTEEGIHSNTKDWVLVCLGLGPGIPWLIAFCAFDLQAKAVFVGYVLTLIGCLNLFVSWVRSPLKAEIYLSIVLVVVIVVPGHHRMMANWQEWAVAAVLVPGLTYLTGYLRQTRKAGRRVESGG